LRDLRVVGYLPGADRVPAARDAQTMAVHARDVLDHARTFANLAGAVEDCGLAIGTTSRTASYRAIARPLREAAAELIALSATNRIAIVFGPEDFGLTKREIKLCQRLITIPTAPDYPSLNLAQAVMVVAYELMMAAGLNAARASRDRGLPALASSSAVDAMLSRLAEALIAIGFLPADNPDHIMLAVRAMLGRSGVTAHECDIVNGIASQILWFGTGGHQTIESKRRAGRKIR
jgi:tRNA/rRNA methyltransferase